MKLLIASSMTFSGSLRVALIALCVLAGCLGAPMETPGSRTDNVRTNAPALTTY